MLAAGIFIDPEKDADHMTHIANFALLVQIAVSAVQNPVTGDGDNDGDSDGDGDACRYFVYNNGKI